MRKIGVTPELVALLNGSPQQSMADLYTVTLNGGSVLRYTSHDKVVTAPAMRNDLTWSEAFDNAAWTKLNMLPPTPNAARSPVGVNTADLLVPNTTNGLHNVSNQWTVGAGSTNALSFYGKMSGTYRYLLLRLGNPGETNYVQATFDLLSGVISTAANNNGTATGAAASIAADPNNFGYWRCTVSGAVPTITTVKGLVYFGNSAGTFSFAGNGVEGFYGWGAQALPGTVAGPYQRTASAAVNNAARTFLTGPLFKRGGISHKIGTEVSTLACTINAGPADLIGSVQFIPFVLGNGLDGATLTLERAFFSDFALAPVGTLIDFLGRVTSIRGISRDELNLTASSQTVLLNVNMPPDLFQTPCLNSLFDGNCTLNPASFAASGTVAAGATTIGFNTNLTQATGYFDQGRIVFTSGANTGLVRAVKSFNHTSGALLLVLPLPAAPANGDTFTAYPGCDLSAATCTSKFSNLIHFRGQPYIPLPETAA